MIRQKSFDAPPFSRREVFRYAGCKTETEEVSRLVDKCCEETEGRLSYRVCYDIYDLRRSGDTLSFANINTQSDTLKTAFNGCGGVLVFGATVGAEMDRLILKYAAGKNSPAAGEPRLRRYTPYNAKRAFCPA